MGVYAACGPKFGCMGQTIACIDSREFKHRCLNLSADEVGGGEFGEDGELGGNEEFGEVGESEEDGELGEDEDDLGAFYGVEIVVLPKLWHELVEPSEKDSRSTYINTPVRPVSPTANSCV